MIHPAAPPRIVRVALRTTDPVTEAGLTAYLRHPAVVVQAKAEGDDADVLVLVAERLTKPLLSELRRSAAESDTPVVLVCQQITDVDLIAMAACRIVVVLPRQAATRERLLESIRTAANGGAVLSPTHLRELLRQAEAWHHDPALLDSGATALTLREAKALSMAADGLGPSEIARQLNYSERTIKNIFSGVTRRLKLRNRTHAVAYAIRSGLIH
jgi:DNA-binding NarL/FixJ family response regulator